MLKVSQLSYRYPGSSENVLSEINFSVQNGEIVALVGQNGSGKSTLGRLIAGISDLQAGTVRIDGNIYDQTSRGIRQNLGIVFQNPENQLLFNTFDEEIKFALSGSSDTKLPKPATPELKKRIRKSLAQVGMSDFRNREIDELSLGQKQRLVLAETLARGPQHLILDEPTTMTDSEGKREIAKLVQGLAKSGHCILYITNLADELLLADRVLILSGGRIAAEIQKTELIQKANLLKRHHIELPTILQLLVELKQHGIDITPGDFDVASLAQGIKKRFGAKNRGKTPWLS